MSTGYKLLILVGQIGSGKTEVSRHLAEISGAQHLTLEHLRRRGERWAKPTTIVDHVVSKVRVSPGVLECTGASRDFEEIVEGLRVQGIDSQVILLRCRIETALHRVLGRVPVSRPRSGRSWAAELRRTESRLRLVPADYTISTEGGCARDVAMQIHRIWMEEHREADTKALLNIDGDLSYSRLAAFQVCPLSYKLKYIDKAIGAVEPKEMLLGRVLHETLAWMYSCVSNIPSKSQVIDWFSRKLREGVPENLTADVLEEISRIGEHALAFHFDVVYQIEKPRTIAVEKLVSMKLSEGINYVGRIDRLVVDLAGLVEIVDYKTFDRKPMYKPRLPDQLQIAGYGAAMLREQGLQSVIAREVCLQTGRDERFLIGLGDVRQVELALLRWARRVYSRESFPAKIGPHCASCQFKRVCPEAGRVLGSESL